MTQAAEVGTGGPPVRAYLTFNQSERTRRAARPYQYFTNCVTIDNPGPGEDRNSNPRSSIGSSPVKNSGSLNNG
jgi:hypothetical protein